MAIYLYVDNSNLFIEGKRVSAVKKGLSKNIFDAMNNQKFDNSWRLDFGSLHDHVSSELGDSIASASLFGSKPPANDSVWKMANQNGFTTNIFDRNVANKEKKVDTSIITEMMNDAFTKIDKENDKIVLVAGDADFVPVINSLKSAGFDTHVVFWGHASNELKNSASSSFHSLDDEIDSLGY